jgi:hypothetical protein
MTLTRKEILHAFADDKVVQKCHEHCADWRSVTLEDYVDYPKANYRIKPETILVNGVECPAPMPHENVAGAPLWYAVVVRIYQGTEKVFYFNTEADARQVFAALVKPFSRS